MHEVVPARLALETWKAQARDGEPASVILRKGSLETHIKAEGDQKYTFTISTGAVDRDHDTLAVEGWDLKNYRKNPIILYGHNSSGLPIGASETVTVSGASLKARAKFVPAEVYPLADTVRQMVDLGFLRATSVGFLPKTWTYDEERGGVNFLTQELYEWSIVPIPANPEALSDAKAAGVDMAPMLAEAERILDLWEPGLWVPKKVAAAAFETLAAPAFAVEWSPDETVKLTAAALEKRGRTLSAANEAKVREARDASAAIAEALDAVLVQVAETDDDDKAGRRHAGPSPPPYLALRQEPKEVRHNVDLNHLDVVVSQAVTGAVGAAIRQLTGRLD